MVLAGGLVLLNNLVDEAAVLLQTELSIVTNLRPYLGRALRKLLPAVELPQVGMLGDLEHRRSFLRVEAERPAQQVVGLRGAVAHPLLATDWLYLREDVEHLSAEVSLERAQVLDGGRASPSEHSLDLVEGGVSGEHGLAREQFAQQAPETPNVRCLRVLLGPQEDLGSPVPARGNVVGQVGVGVGVLVEGADESEVAYFGEAVLVDENVGGFDVAVDEVGGVEVVEGLGQLVGDVAFVLLLQQVLLYQSEQVDVHQLQQDVDVLLPHAPYHLPHLDYVRVPHLHQHHYLSVRPLRVSRVLEGVEVFLQRVCLSCGFVDHLPNNSVGPAAHLLLYLEAIEDVVFECLVLAHNTGITAVIISSSNHISYPEGEQQPLPLPPFPSNMSLPTRGFKRPTPTPFLNDSEELHLPCCLPAGWTALSSAWTWFLLDLGVGQYQECAMSGQQGSGWVDWRYWFLLLVFLQWQGEGSQVRCEFVSALSTISFLLYLLPRLNSLAPSSRPFLLFIRYSSSTSFPLPHPPRLAPFLPFYFYWQLGSVLCAWGKASRAGRSPKNCLRDLFRQRSDLDLINAFG